MTHLFPANEPATLLSRSCGLHGAVFQHSKNNAPKCWLVCASLASYPHFLWTGSGRITMCPGCRVLSDKLPCEARSPFRFLTPIFASLATSSALAAGCRMRSATARDFSSVSFVRLPNAVMTGRLPTATCIVKKCALAESTDMFQNLPMSLFDMRAFYAELDKQRRSRGLTWTQLATEINRPFESTSSIPISPGTLRDMLKKRSVTSAVVFQVLRWLGRTPESFLPVPCAVRAPR